MPNLIVDRLFYFNSFANPKRRQFMESWIQEYHHDPQQQQQQQQENAPQILHYDRLEPIQGDVASHCPSTSSRQPQEDCLRNLRLGHTYQYLLRHANYYGILPPPDDLQPPSSNDIHHRRRRNGMTLVLHDDNVQITPGQWKRLEEEISIPQAIPSTWQALRLDCSDQHDDKPIVTSTCRSSKAILWRDSGFLQLRHNLRKGKVLDVDCRLEEQEANRIESYCIRLNLLLGDPALELEEPPARMVESISQIHRMVPLDDLMQENQQRPIPNTFLAPNDNASMMMMVDRIYYNSLEKNHLRQDNMESWLHDLQVDIPHKRLPALVGRPDLCEGEKRGSQCEGVSGLSMTLVALIDDEVTTGISLVLEDDFVLHDAKLERLHEVLKMVPNDWDIIRFECWELRKRFFDKVNEYVTDTSVFDRKGECTNQCKGYCGGTHAMLFRGDRVSKLRDMWSTVPYNAVDCRISQWGKLHGLKSYCVNIGIGHLLKIANEKTDIVKPKRKRDG